MIKDTSSGIAIIIVTYNSDKFIHKAIRCINQQTLQPERIIIVDSGSSDYSYLEKYRNQNNVSLVFAEKECGFCKGNNIGMKYLPEGCRYVFFLNPDAFLTPTYLEKAVNFLNLPTSQNYGALTGILEGYDLEFDRPRGTYDTTGIFKTWYGRWYDRDQGQKCQQFKYQEVQSIPAICGASFFCRKEALNMVLIRDREVFDNSFYMYKEDIDLSLRFKQKGWDLAFVPDMLMYHCRGWQQDRAKMPRKFRLCSARNELVIQKKLKAPVAILYSLIKYTAVKVLDK